MNAVLAYVNESDARISGRVRGWMPPRWVRWWMLWATKIGDGWVWFAAAFLLLDGAGRWRRILAAAALAAGLGNLALVLLKRTFRRKRPCDLAPHPAFSSIRVSGYLRYIPSDRFSFPSGHSMNAFALATVLGLTFPWMAPAALVAASSIAASRVILGLHFVSDVVVGSTLGLAIGAATYFAVVL